MKTSGGDHVRSHLFIEAMLVTTALGCAGGAPSEEEQDVADSNDALWSYRASGESTFRNGAGFAETVSARGYIDRFNPFFQPLGTNGRACVTCHVPEDGWGLRPETAQQLFDETGGTHPLFRTNDGSVCPDADVSTVAARRSAYALLLDKGLIRIGIGIPADAEFELEDVEGAYCNAVGDDELSLFRRPIPSTNLELIPAVMWDGRETLVEGYLHEDLAHQADDATLGHAQARRPLPDAVQKAIVDFETSLFTAQIFTYGVGILDRRGALGGPTFLATVPFQVGMNQGRDHDLEVFSLFGAWSRRRVWPGQASVARGEAIFNNRSFRIRHVAGMPSDDAVGQCSTCHLTPNAGSHSSAAFFDLGLSDAQARTPDLPLYTLRNRITGEARQTSDPGRALITGRWSDVGAFKPSNLRALASHAPYFHNGFAKTLDDVVGFYDSRFQIGLTPSEHADLVLFLQSL